MNTYNTGNPLGSAAAKDLYDNAQNFDHLSNDLVNETWKDRFGVDRLTWHGMEERYKTAIVNLGFNPIGTFQDGATLNAAGDIIQDETTGTWYRWDDLTTLPKTVPSGSTPDSTGGTGSGKWLAVDVSDVLRKDLSESSGTSLIGDESGLTLQERLHYDASDIALYGYVYGSGADAKQPILDAIARTGKAHVSGDITLSRFDWPEGAKLEGKGTISYTRRPSVPCELDSYTPVNHAKMKATWVYGVFDICDMLQLKTAGFNTIIHYGYSFTDGGTFEKACNAAEAVGINVIINSPNDVPPTSDVNLGTRDCVIGYYLYDEPQHLGASVAAQNARVDAWRSVTEKLLCIADNGIYGFGNNTISPYYDVIFVDSYYLSSSNDEQNKTAAISAWCELLYKSNFAKLVPAVGLFTGDTATDKQKQLSFSKACFKFGSGDYAAFSWESSVAAPSHLDIITDTDFYNQAKIFNNVFTQKPYECEFFAFGPGLGVGGLMRTINLQYTSPDIKPFTVINAGTDTDERHQYFSDTGLAFRNSAGNVAFNLSNKGSATLSIVYRNHADDGSAKVGVFFTGDDYYTSTQSFEMTLSHSTGFTRTVEVGKNTSLGISITPLTTSPYLFKFLTGAIITTSWYG